MLLARIPKIERFIIVSGRSTDLWGPSQRARHRLRRSSDLWVHPTEAVQEAPISEVTIE